MLHPKASVPFGDLLLSTGAQLQERPAGSRFDFERLTTFSELDGGVSVPFILTRDRPVDPGY